MKSSMSVSVCVQTSFSCLIIRVKKILLLLPAIEVSKYLGPVKKFFEKKSKKNIDKSPYISVMSWEMLCE